MLIEFIRASREASEDPNTGEPVVRPIAINPRAVIVVHSSLESDNVVIVKMSDGRGYLVQGTYADVMVRLFGGTAAPQELSGDLRGERPALDIEGSQH